MAAPLPYFHQLQPARVTTNVIFHWRSSPPIVRDEGRQACAEDHVEKPGLAGFRNSAREFTRHRRSLFPLGGRPGGPHPARHGHRAAAVPGLAERPLQRLVQDLLRRAAEQGLGHLHLAARRVQRACRLLHRQRRVSDLSAAMAADQVAALAHHALSSAAGSAAASITACG